MTLPNVVTVAVVGLGYWGPHYARIASELPNTQLRWCCDLDAALLELPRRRYPGVGCASNLDQVLEDDAVDAVVVATPTRTHADLVAAALNAGKHVLVEKPLARSTAECARIEAAVGDRLLMVGHTFVYNPALVALRDSISDGQLGKLHYMTAVRAGLGPIRQDVNALWDLGPHDVAIFLELHRARPTVVNAVGRAFLTDDREDVVDLHIRFEDGVTSHAHLSWLEPYKVRRTTVVGDQRMAVFDDISTDERLKIFDRGASYSAPAEAARGQNYGEYRAIVRDGAIVIPQIPRAEPLTEQFKEFIAAILETRPPRTGFEQGRDVVAVLEAADRSLSRGGAPEAVGSGLTVVV